MFEAIEKKLFQQSVSQSGQVIGSGKIKHPGKRFILLLVSECVSEFNELRDKKNGWPYVRKAMVMTGHGLDDSGVWNTEQLSSKLKGIIERNPDYFSLEKFPYDDIDPHKNGPLGCFGMNQEQEQHDCEDAHEDNEDQETEDEHEEGNGEDDDVDVDEEDEEGAYDTHEEEEEFNDEESNDDELINVEEENESSERVTRAKKRTVQACEMNDALIAAILQGQEDFDPDVSYDYDAKWSDWQ
jgi:hypothetical protein